MKIRAKLRILIVFVLLIAACSENPLAEVGHRTRDWIGDGADRQSATTVSTIRVVSFHSASDVTWANDILAPEPVAADEALQTVWQRRETGNKYVQAARVEIAGALPGIAFLDLLPEKISYISSQLLFDGDGSLANDFVAAFGLWTAEPYTVSRSVGQYGILWVTYPNPELSGCDRFASRELSSCETVLFGGRTAWRLSAGGEQRLVWLDGDYQYEFFHRSQVDPETALKMAERMVPLGEITPQPPPEQVAASA